MATARKTPAAHEALGEKIPFTWNGVDFLLTPTADWDYEVLEHFEEGRLIAFLKAVLGAEQHAAFKATKPKVRDLEDFVEQIQVALGIQGN